MAVTVYSQSEPLVDSRESPVGGLMLRASLRSQRIAMVTLLLLFGESDYVNYQRESWSQSQSGLCVQFKVCECWSGAGGDKM